MRKHILSHHADIESFWELKIETDAVLPVFPLWFDFCLPCAQASFFPSRSQLFPENKKLLKWVFTKL